MTKKQNPFVQRYNTCAPPLFLNYGERHLTVYQSLTRLSSTNRHISDAVQSVMLTKIRNQTFKNQQKQQKTQEIQSELLDEQISQNSPRIFWKNILENKSQKTRQNPFSKYQEQYSNICRLKTKKRDIQLSVQEILTNRKNKAQEIRQQIRLLKGKLNVAIPSYQQKYKKLPNSSVLKLYRQRKIEEAAQAGKHLKTVQNDTYMRKTGLLQPQNTTRVKSPKHPPMYRMYTMNSNKK